MKTLKLASTKYLDALPTTGNEHGRAFRDLAMEAKVMEIARATGIGAQFGGKYFALDVRVVRLARQPSALADAGLPVWSAQVESLLFDGANSAVLLRESRSNTEFRIALPQTGEFADLTVGETVAFGFDPQRAVCFAAPATATEHVFS